MSDIGVQVLDVKGLMTYLGISRATAYELVNTEGFPASHIGRRIVVPVEALKEWLLAGGTQQKGA